MSDRRSNMNSRKEKLSAYYDKIKAHTIVLPKALACDNGTQSMNKRSCFNRNVIGSIEGLNETCVYMDGEIQNNVAPFVFTIWIFLQSSQILWAPEENPVEWYIEDGYLPIVHNNWKISNRVKTAEGQLFEQYDVYQETFSNFLKINLSHAIDIVRLKIRRRDRSKGNNGRLSIYSVIRSITPEMGVPSEMNIDRIQRFGVFDLRCDPSNGSIFLDNNVILKATRPANMAGVVSSSEGEISQWARVGKVPSALSVHDPDGLASGALVFEAVIQEGEEFAIDFVLPTGESFKEGVSSLIKPVTLVEKPTPADLQQVEPEKLKQETKIYWQKFLEDGMKIEVPDIRITNAYYASIINLLIMLNHDEFMVGPGVYGFYLHDLYAALNLMDKIGAQKILKTILPFWTEKIVKEDGSMPQFLNQLDNVAGCEPYLDGPAKLIFVLVEHYKFYKNEEWLRKEAFPVIMKAVDVLRKWRAPMLDDKFKGTPLYGTMHQSGTWDNGPSYNLSDSWSTLLGFKSAMDAAKVLGETDLLRSITADYESLYNCFMKGIEIVMKRDNLQYLPERLDAVDNESVFSGSQYTYCLWPGYFANLDLSPEFQELLVKSYASLSRSQGLYDDDDILSAYPKLHWRGTNNNQKIYTGSATLSGYVVLWDAHPYLLLGNRDKCMHYMEWAVTHLSCPGGWFEFADINRCIDGFYAGRNDGPHGWIAAEYCLTLRDMLLYEDLRNNCLRICSGVPEKWLEAGRNIEVSNAMTYYGKIGYKITCEETQINISIERSAEMATDIMLDLPSGLPIKQVVIDNTSVSYTSQLRISPGAKEIILHR